MESHDGTGALPAPVEGAASGDPRVPMRAEARRWAAATAGCAALTPVALLSFPPATVAVAGLAVLAAGNWRRCRRALAAIDRAAATPR